MLDFLKPIQAENLTDACVDRLEELILSGKFSVGKRLPSQRMLAQQLGVSRPVVQEALFHLASKGLVEMVPRVGIIVNDYREKGTIGMLASLFRHQREKAEPKLYDGLFELRFLLEMEFAHLAALHRTDEHIRQLREIITIETATDPTNTDTFAELIFEFHLVVAMATNNQVYPMLLNSFKIVYIHMAAIFYSTPDVVRTAIAFQRDLTDAIKKQDSHLATAAMRCILSYGEECLAYLRQTVPDEAI